MFDVTPIAKAILTLLATVITCVVVPWIRMKTTKGQREILRGAVKVLVLAAEQLYGSGNGARKMEYVQEKLAEAGFVIDTDEVEAAVKEYLNGEKKEAEDETEEDLIAPANTPICYWPVEMLREFCLCNGVPCLDCVTREDYIRAIVGGYAVAEEPAAEEAPENGEKDPAALAEESADNEKDPAALQKE